MKSGFIAVLGKPNAGKSSLVNALIGQKVSIVSPKAQTTRDRILGVLTEKDYQMVFIDTPGFVKPTSKLGEYMDKCITAAHADADAIVYVIDAQKPLTDRDFDLIEKYGAIAPLYVVLNKEDLCKYERIYPLLQRICDYGFKNPPKEIIPVSAKRGRNVELLKEKLHEILTDETQYFDEDYVSDKSIAYMVCEIIREKALWLLNDEIPHGIGVLLQSMQKLNGVLHIEADIICEKDNHKQIIIGENGDKLKDIGTRARLDIERLLEGQKVFLKLFVKIRENWRNRKTIMEDIGYC